MTALNSLSVNKYIKSKKKIVYDHFHNILRLSDVLQNCPLTACETMCDYYL